jgi:hypothetical protein
MDWLHNIHNYIYQHLKLASDRKKIHYNFLPNSADYQKGDQAWLYHATRTKGKSPKLQPSWEGTAVTQINDVVHMIQQHPRKKMTNTLPGNHSR